MVQFCALVATALGWAHCLDELGSFDGGVGVYESPSAMKVIRSNMVFRVPWTEWSWKVMMPIIVAP